MKLLDLFSGIGGFSLGAEYNNIETIGFVEKDAFCQKVLRKHWPNTPIIGNIRDVTKDTFKSVDIVSGGFPCQPFSVAGKRRGTDDDRYLWDETIRVVSLYKPRWFVGENVEGIVNIQNGMVLRQVQDDLEKEGFEVQCGIIPASGIGAWHQRKRVWIIAHSNSNRESRCSQYVQERPRELGESHVSNTIGELSDGCSGTTRHSESELKGMVSDEAKNWNKVWSKTERCDQQTGLRGNVSDTTVKGLERHGSQSSDLQESKERQDNSDRGSQGQHTWWQTESKLRGIPHGISYELDKDRANRIKALGNSIVPQIAYQLFKSIVTVTKEDNHEQVYWC